MTALAIARCIFVGLVTVLALLAVFRAPIGALWMPAVASTEGGYLLALLTIPAFVGGVATRTDQVLCAVGVACIAFFVSPLVRARAVARETPSELPRLLVARTGRRSPSNEPLAFSRLLSFESDDVPIETMTYATRDADVPLRLDLYGAPNGKSRPLVVMIHGGSWSGGDRTQLPAIARRLAHDGWAVASIAYRLAPANRFPAAFDDVRAAVDFLRENAEQLGLDADRVVLYGRSAGAHLALLAAYRWHAPFVRGVVALYAPTDLVWSWEHPSNPLVLNTPVTLGAFLGGGPSESATMRELYRDASPIEWVDAASPPTLLVHGERDGLVFPRQTERLAEVLDAANIPHFALLLPWATHGCEASLAGPSGQLVEASVRYFLSVVAPVR